MKVSKSLKKEMPRLRLSDALDGVSSRRIAIGYALVVIFFCLWYNALYNLMAGGSIWPYESPRLFLRQFTLGSIPFILLFLLNTLLVFRINPFDKIPARLGFDILGSGVIVIAVNFAFYGISVMLGKQPRIFWAASYVVDFLTLLLNEVFYFVLSYRLSQSRADKARRTAAELQYDVLKAQVNPHFLFNSLNLLYSLVDLDTEKSKEFILSLSKMYRYIMIQHERQRVRVAEELELVGFYTEVLKMRFLNQLEVEVTVEEDAGDDPLQREIIPFSLQMLLENATKHNVIRNGMPMKIDISVGKEGITVTNIIRKKQTLPPSGIGLSLGYLKKLYTYYDKEFLVEKTDEIFKVFVPYLDNQNN